MTAGYIYIYIFISPRHRTSCTTVAKTVGTCSSEMRLTRRWGSSGSGVAAGNIGPVKVLLGAATSTGDGSDREVELALSAAGSKKAAYSREGDR